MRDKTYKFISVWVLVVLLPLHFSACATKFGADTGNSCNCSDVFCSQLTEEYKTLSLDMKRRFQFKDASYFKRKYLVSCSGIRVLPQEVQKRRFDEKTELHIISLRNSLLDMIKQQSDNKKSRELAIVQVSFDCYLREKEKYQNNEFDSRCKKDFDELSVILETKDMSTAHN